MGASNLETLSLLVVGLIIFVLCLSPGACIDPQMPHNFLSPLSESVIFKADEFLAIVNFFLKYAFSRFGNFVGTALYLSGIAGAPLGLALLNDEALPTFLSYDEGLRDGFSAPGTSFDIPWSWRTVPPSVAFLFLNTLGLMSICTSSFFGGKRFLIGVGRATNLLILLLDLTESNLPLKAPFS